VQKNCGFDLEFCKAKSKRMKFLYLVALAFIAMFIYLQLAPVREFKRIPTRHVASHIANPKAKYDSSKRTVLIIADNKGTEIFDLIAPYYLFSLTKQFDIFIVSKNNAPIAVMKGFFTMPHWSMKQIDSMGISPSVIVVPNLSGTDRDKQDIEVLNWISKKSLDSVKVLAICAGSVTAAATGLYDGRPMTTHASEMEDNKKQFGKPQWQEDVTYTKSGNYFSTAGVSNAVEGSLAVINDILGTEAVNNVIAEINYPYSSIKMRHRSLPIMKSDKITVLKKVTFGKDPNIGVFLQEGVDEFTLAAVLDAYHRTFPSSLKTFSFEQKPITSRFGLVILPTGDSHDLQQVNEMHVVSPQTLSANESGLLAGKSLVNYNLNSSDQYIFDVCLQRIGSKYGIKMQTVVKRLLDYN
jgi:putative intracellular protease/amidase